MRKLFKLIAQIREENGPSNRKLAGAAAKGKQTKEEEEAELEEGDEGCDEGEDGEEEALDDDAELADDIDGEMLPDDWQCEDTPPSTAKKPSSKSDPATSEAPAVKKKPATKDEAPPFPLPCRRFKCKMTFEDDDVMYMGAQKSSELMDLEEVLQKIKALEVQHHVCK